MGKIHVVVEDKDVPADPGIRETTTSCFMLENGRRMHPAGSGFCPYAKTPTATGEMSHE